MTTLFDIVKQLTSSTLNSSEKARLLNDFAYHFGWNPSDSLDAPQNDYANAHLLVEHGLENTAVITFLQRRFSDLSYGERKGLLNISYNNLVDWHIHIEPDTITYVFNRSYPEKIVSVQRISRNDLDALRSTWFEEVAGQRQNPNLPALDEALIGTVSFWKHYLAIELHNSVSNEELAALFNAIIFVRAVEDHYRKISVTHNEDALQTTKILLDSALADNRSMTLSDIIFASLERLGHSSVPSTLIDAAKLRPFNSLEANTVSSIIRDFYAIRGVRPYEYDFSVMSKHALSRVYEKYVALLKFGNSDQTSLFVTSPEEERNRNLAAC